MSTSQQNISNRDDDFADWAYVTRWSHFLWPLPVKTTLRIYRMTRKDRLNWLSDQSARWAWVFGVSSAIGMLVGAYVFIWFIGTKDLAPNWSEKIFWISLINIAPTTALGLLSYWLEDAAKYA